MTRESHIEQRLIDKLTELKYTYRDDIRDRDALELNFREKFNKLNSVKLTDSEFNRLLDEIINPDVFAASKHLREQNVFQRDDDTPLYYTLVNIKDWCKNEYEVVNQLRINTRNSNQRYDVILLINGIPVVQIELKNHDIVPHRAMEQIIDYKNTPGNGYNNTLLCFMQLYIVSNEKSSTYYFANNNNQHLSFNADEQFLPIYQWADEDNRKINDLQRFCDRFLVKCKLGEMINRYMVLVASEQKLLIMRPYQIYAVQAIVKSIEENRGNGYIWHTTGSGKTLTSFKASTLLKDRADVEKCLFVVDRKDLDKQTREEFNKFQEGCVEENTNTETLVKRMLSNNYADKVIVTTIQKLGLALDADHKKNYKQRLEPLRNKRIVLIFDECHRSQFGENHKAIKEFFPNAQLFGFTGTPIFEENSKFIQLNGEEGSYRTTEDVFGERLHAYTITHAIEDNNVLRFHIDYFRPADDIKTKVGDTFAKSAIIEAILSKHDSATRQRQFNAILATASINDAIEYYGLFKAAQAKLQEEDKNVEKLNIACVFSPPAEGNKDVQQIQEDLPNEKANNKVEPEKKKRALKNIIAEYNIQYGTNHTINEFDLYYQDIQSRIKDQKYTNSDYARKNKIDITIVVDMLLTGFDSKYLNTLYVDKKLEYHGLIQAFSRTNRILNDTKPYGNILDFRQQQDQVDRAITRFSGEETSSESAKKIWLVDPAPAVIKEYQTAVERLDEFMKAQGVECTPEEVHNLRGDEARAGFINHFKEIQRLKTRLDQYTDLNDEDNDKIKQLMSEDQLRGFRAIYLETAKRLKKKRDKEDNNVSSEVEELDFEFVLFASAIIDYDYIMGLIAKFTQPSTSKQKMTREQLISLVGASANLMNERDDIVDYINSLSEVNGLTESEIRNGFETFKSEKFAKELATIAERHELSIESLKAFVEGIIARMIFDGELLVDLLAPLDLGWRARTKKELALMDDLVPLLKRLAEGREISGLSAYEE